MSWRGTEGGEQAAARGLNAVMAPTPYHYFDHYQNKDQSIRLIGGYIPIEKVYSYNPVPDDASAEMKKHIIGVQANLWTEYVGYPQHVYYMLLPRLDAISEVQWCRPDQKDFKNFKQRLPKMKRLYDKLGINYCGQEE